MGNVFGRDKPLKEVLRENKRMINRAVRELDREKVALEREEKRLTMEIKKAAKEQQMASVKIMAKVSIGRHTGSASSTQFTFAALTHQLSHTLSLLQGPRSNASIHNQVHRNAKSLARMRPEATNCKITSCHGRGYEGNGKGHVQNEQSC